MELLLQKSIIQGRSVPFESKRLNIIFEEAIGSSNDINKSAIISLTQNDEHERCITYDALNKKANQLAEFIVDQVNKKKLTANQDGDFAVAVCMPPSDHMITTLLAIWKSGAAYLPIDPTFPSTKIEHILSDSNPVMVVYDQYENVTVFGNILSISYVEFENLSLSYSGKNVPTANTVTKGKNDLAIVLYTSGSTGFVRGVRIPHSAILNRLKWQWSTFPYSGTEKVCIFKTSFTFVDSVAELWSPLLNNLTVLVVPKTITLDPARLVNVLEKFSIERLVLVPTLLHSILMYFSIQKEKTKLQNLKLWICSGETLPLALASTFFDHFAEGKHVLCNFYGSTEVMGDVTYFVCKGKRQLSTFDKIPIGSPLYNTVVCILDYELQPIENGAIGEIFVSGLNLAQGYVNVRDQQKFIENPLSVDAKYNRLYRTGDFASVLKNGVIQYEGRIDSQIKIRGHRVDLAEVESNLLSLDDIDKGIVLCYHPGESDQTMLAFITLTGNSTDQLAAHFENALKSKLIDYMIPQIVIMDTIPLLLNGKIDRQALLNFYENTNNKVLDFNFDGVPDAKLTMAKDLLEIVAHVIGRPTRSTISVCDNFYDLGGHSLNSIYAVTQLKSKGYTISITEFITASTLKDVLDKLMIGIVDTELKIESKMQLKEELLTARHKNEAVKIISDSFFEKGDLEEWLNVDYTDYDEILAQLWPDIIANNLSFAVLNESGQMVGISLNVDYKIESEITTESELAYIFEFLCYIENLTKDSKLNHVNQILHSFIMATSANMSAQENIFIFNFMEEQLVKLAKQQKLSGIMACNTNLLTQQLGYVHGYETLLDYQVNQYVYRNGNKPFGRAPDSQRVLVQWKSIVDSTDA